MVWIHHWNWIYWLKSIFISEYLNSFKIYCMVGIQFNFSFHIHSILSFKPILGIIKAVPVLLFNMIPKIWVRPFIGVRFPRWISILGYFSISSFLRLCFIVKSQFSPILHWLGLLSSFVSLLWFWQREPFHKQWIFDLKPIYFFHNLCSHWLKLWVFLYHYHCSFHVPKSIVDHLV